MKDFETFELEPTDTAVGKSIKSADAALSKEKDRWTGIPLVMLGVGLGLLSLTFSLLADRDGLVLGLFYFTEPVAFIAFSGLVLGLGVVFLMVSNAQRRFTRERCMKMEAQRTRWLHEENMVKLSQIQGTQDIGVRDGPEQSPSKAADPLYTSKLEQVALNPAHVVGRIKGDLL